MNKAIILLSGGLDSLVSLGLAMDKYNVDLALTFDYGQKSAEQEIEQSAKICAHYGINHKVIKLDWLKEITHTALVSDAELPQEANEDSMKAVWVPNRNGLFLNIAASYADDGQDTEGYSTIIFGANADEAKTFSDNSADFVEKINAEFELSTLKKPKVVAPLLNFSKDDIVKIAIEKQIPLELAYSCYRGGQRHCGVCESCIRLKSALERNNHKIEGLFEN